MNALVGYTGFVGSNLYKNGSFDKVYNSRNISESYGLEPDLLVYAGLRAEKYLANNEPQKDMEQISEAEENIRRINPKKLVLISTIDVFKTPAGVDENSHIKTEGLHAYGYNRYMLELWVRENYSDALIIRLPGLFGENIKKNFIYDYINIIPFMLKENKYFELVAKAPIISEFYNDMGNGFFKVNVSEEKKDDLKEVFKKLGFSALNFTDSRSKYQFYNLENLWEDIQIALKEDLHLWHPATEPISARELYNYLEKQDFINELDGVPANYNYKTIYAELFGGENGYICNKDNIMDDIRKFVKKEI